MWGRTAVMWGRTAVMWGRTAVRPYTILFLNRSVSLWITSQVSR